MTGPVRREDKVSPVIRVGRVHVERAVDPQRAVLARRQLVDVDVAVAARFPARVGDALAVGRPGGAVGQTRLVARQHLGRAARDRHDRQAALCRLADGCRRCACPSGDTSGSWTRWARVSSRTSPVPRSSRNRSSQLTCEAARDAMAQRLEVSCAGRPARARRALASPGRRCTPP